MASMFEILLKFLRVLRFAKNYIKRFLGHRAVILALLRLKWGICSALDGSADLEEYVTAVAGSSVPGSASSPGLQERPDQERDTREPGATTPPGGVSVSPPAGIATGHQNERTHFNQGRQSFSSQRDFSYPDRFTDIVRSSTCEPLHAAVGQPSRASTMVHIPAEHGPSVGMVHYDELAESEVTPSRLLTRSPLAISEPEPPRPLHVPERHLLQLINSEQVPRYERRTIRPILESEFVLEPLMTNFHHLPDGHGCDPWIPATHPMGALYFYDPVRRLFTDTNMFCPILRDEMEHLYDFLLRFLHFYGLDIPSGNYDLVLDVTPIEGMSIQWSYYFACHETRCLFWLEQYNAQYMISELQGVRSPAHIKLRLEALYWRHWSLFPVAFEGRHLPIAVYDELMGLLSFGCLDVMTSKDSTFPYDDNSMQKMINFVKRGRETCRGEEYYAAGASHLLYSFSHWKFLCFHGERNARLVRDQTVYDSEPRERSLLITLLSPALFLAPDVCLKEIEAMWTDEVIVVTTWQNFMSKLLGEWERVILWATVMLSANVGFLAIPGVVLTNPSGGNVNQSITFTSSAQIASCISAQVSVGTIVVGLLLIRHNVVRRDESSVEAARYLFQKSQRIFGLEPLAIIYSLPWALLMWSMTIFSISLLSFCFTISSTSARIATGTTSFFVAVLVAWCIRSAWESSDDMGVRRSSLLALQRARNRLFARLKRFVLIPLRSFPTRHGQTLTTGGHQGRVGGV